MWGRYRDVKFDSKLVRLVQSGIFIRLVSVHFGSASQNVLKLIFKSPGFVPFAGQSDPIRMPNLTPLFSMNSDTSPSSVIRAMSIRTGKYGESSEQRVSGARETGEVYKQL